MIKYPHEIANILFPLVSIPITELENLLEVPPKEEMGDYAFPCFRLAKELKKNPVQIAADLKQQLDNEPIPWLKETRTAGPYLNFFLSRSYFAQDLLSEILQKKENFGHSEQGKGKNIIVEYSSPNIAKPFHIGHAFTTILGQVIGNLYEALGYNVIRMNHLGDYGTQFGKLIVAWRLWGDEHALKEAPIKELTRIYVKFHEEAKTRPELEGEAREAFRKLENNSPDEVELWQKFRDMSLVEFNKLYQRMHIHFDNFNGESFYSDLIPEVVEMLKEKDLLEESQGAQVVDLKEFNLNPCIILKSDGTTIYASRDIAAILYRDRTYDFDKNIYVVGLPQSNHFQQVFAVLKKTGFPKADKNIHVGFGTVKFKDGTFSSRSGNIILLQDLLDQSVEKTKAIIEHNNPDMSTLQIDSTAEAIGLAAITYTYLRNSRERDIFFDWDEMLDFEGDTAPYLIYTYARANSILQKSNLDKEQLQSADFGLLESDDEYGLLKDMYQYPRSLIEAAEQYEPSIYLRKISQLARDFNRFYHNVPILKTQNAELQKARLALTYAVTIVLGNALRLSAMTPVERM